MYRSQLLLITLWEGKFWLSLYSGDEETGGPWRCLMTCPCGVGMKVGQILHRSPGTPGSGVPQSRVQVTATQRQDMYTCNGI